MMTSKRKIAAIFLALFITAIAFFIFAHDRTARGISADDYLKRGPMFWFYSASHDWPICSVLLKGPIKQCAFQNNTYNFTPSGRLHNFLLEKNIQYEVDENGRISTVRLHQGQILERPTLKTTCTTTEQPLTTVCSTNGQAKSRKLHYTPSTGLLEMSVDDKVTSQQWLYPDKQQYRIRKYVRSTSLNTTAEREVSSYMEFNYTYLNDNQLELVLHYVADASKLKQETWLDKLVDFTVSDREAPDDWPGNYASDEPTKISIKILARDAYGNPTKILDTRYSQEHTISYQYY